MRLKNEIEYVFRILMYMSTMEREAVIPSAEIAEKENIPHLFSIRILKKMEKAGIVSVVKGSKGGYRLIADPKKITLRDAIACIDEDLIIREDEDKMIENSSYPIIIEKIKKIEEKLDKNLRDQNFFKLSSDWISSK